MTPYDTFITLLTKKQKYLLNKNSLYYSSSPVQTSPSGVFGAAGLVPCIDKI